MAKKKTRKDVSYWVCCDCQFYLEESGCRWPFSKLSSAFHTQKKAQTDMREKNYLYKNHTSLFIAREVTEVIDSLPRGRSERRRRRPFSN